MSSSSHQEHVANGTNWPPQNYMKIWGKTGDALCVTVVDTVSTPDVERLPQIWLRRLQTLLEAETSRPKHTTLVVTTPYYLSKEDTEEMVLYLVSVKNCELVSRTMGVLVLKTPSEHVVTIHLVCGTNHFAEVASSNFGMEDTQPTNITNWEHWEDCGKKKRKHSENT